MKQCALKPMKQADTCLIYRSRLHVADQMQTLDYNCDFRMQCKHNHFARHAELKSTCGKLLYCVLYSSREIAGGTNIGNLKLLRTKENKGEQSQR